MFKNWDFFEKKKKSDAWSRTLKLKKELVPSPKKKKLVYLESHLKDDDIYFFDKLEDDDILILEA